MAYCAPLGLPHSRFLAWDDEDRAKALAWKIEEATNCPSCGTAEWEWDEDRIAYIPVEKICRGCEIKELVSESSEHHAGKYVTLEPRK